MPIRVKKRKGESSASLIYRFNKRVLRSGIVKETRKRQFRERNPNRNAQRASALYRKNKEKEIEQMRKRGFYEE